MQSLESSSVDCYDPPTGLTLFVGLFLITGTIISYLPQYYVIIKNRTSQGLSFISLGVGLLSSLFTGVNIGIVGWTSMTCCVWRSLNAQQCLANNLKTEQLLTFLLLNTILYVLYVVYMKKPTAFINRDLPEAEGFKVQTKRHRQTNRKLAIWFGIGCLALGILLVAIGLILFYKLHYTSETVLTYGAVMGYLAAVCMGIQWLPQIVTTFRLKGPGSLSLLMLLLQIPGALILIFYQGVLNASPLSVWLPYVFSVLEMIFLICMIGYFECRRMFKNRIRGEGDPLLHSPKINSHLSDSD